MASARNCGSGGTYQTPVPADAVAPLVPQYPLSASTTSAPSRAARSADHDAAGPPPATKTSAVNSSICVLASGTAKPPDNEHVRVRDRLTVGEAPPDHHGCNRPD